MSKLFYWGKDGGKDSKVWGLWLIEWKEQFSIVLLRFAPGTRDAFHNHAFNSKSWVLWGKLREKHLSTGEYELHTPSLSPVITKMDTFHQVASEGTTWVLSFRGPWRKYWSEFIPADNTFRTLSWGRKEVE